LPATSLVLASLWLILALAPPLALTAFSTTATPLTAPASAAALRNLRHPDHCVFSSHAKEALGRLFDDLDLGILSQINGKLLQGPVHRFVDAAGSNLHPLH
jgi:hypothetical protein